MTHLESYHKYQRIVDQAFEYTGGKVQVSMTTDTGNVVAYTISTAAFVQGLNIATKVLNSNLASVLADLNL
jgi:hypothetical protein